MIPMPHWRKLSDILEFNIPDNRPVFEIDDRRLDLSALQCLKSEPHGGGIPVAVTLSSRPHLVKRSGRLIAFRPDRAHRVAPPEDDLASIGNSVSPTAVPENEI
jgi:hypothetical protein